MNGRRLLLTIGVVAFVVIVSIAIFSIDWGNSDTTVKDTVRSVNMADYASTDTKVRMSIRGPVQNNQEGENLQITVGRDVTVGELLSGYQGSVARTEQTGNNAESYKTFLSALQNEGFLEVKLAPRGIQYDGACPKGWRYTFEFVGGQDLPDSTWASNCGKKIGTFDGDLTVVRQLFTAQLPKAQYEALTNDTQF